MDAFLSQAAGMLSPVRQSQLERLPQTDGALVTELRLRVGRPFCVTLRGRTVALLDGPPVTAAELEETFLRLCRGAVYSRADEIAQGFLTAPGGHRVGLCGRAVTQNGVVTGVTNLTSLNVRISRRHAGAADGLLPLLVASNLRSALLFGPPLSGKTTLLRELSFAAAEAGRRVAVVDEREELIPDASAPMDVLRGYPRAAGTTQAVRLFSPELLIFDELGDPSDTAALSLAARSGVKLFTSAHAEDEHALQSRPHLRAAVESGTFDYFIRLSAGATPGQVCGVFDRSFRPVDLPTKTAEVVA